ncbi:DUF937 domain-containing protein [Methylobacterium sp. BTF04]|uniref:DUF937 domain-containing protein n=1 Tax=Methylobacterium sp. BTF04 TaxID=2708300 RepID=UPI0013D58158|nr:DUF937 domain-containing protein [Methylobacterium sp. BTF04]NEU11413.1 DUF937 domain-containing protein [Methylobacterium sp. BTF04]
MFNLFDILQAQAGPGALGFGQQFGLSQDQSRRAMEALLPAFTMGLQRNAANDPTGFSHLFNLVGPNAMGMNAGAATPQMEMLVRQLFGSPHLSQAVLQQAATASGVASPILKQMLPMMAGMIVAGIVHVMINQNQSAAPAPAPASPFGFPGQAWSDMMQSFLAPAGLSPQGKPSAASGTRSAGGSRGATATPRASLTSRPAAKAPEKAGGDAPFDMFQQMFQTGLEVQQENAKAMKSLFDTFWQDQGKTQTEVQPPTDMRAPADPKPKMGRSAR